MSRLIKIIISLSLSIFWSQKTWAYQSPLERYIATPTIQGVNNGWSLEVGLLTGHFRDQYRISKGNQQWQYFDYNEDNKVIGLGYRIGTLTFAATTFENSYFKRSYMTSVEHDLIEVGRFNFDVNLGLVSGYDKDIYKSGIFLSEELMLSVLLGVSYRFDWLNFGGTQLVPKFRLMGTEAYLLNLEFEF
ncbi:hypothetical protein [Paraferrimonas sp. SM1919]|uniref:hypothetical protein n=1 Tax=Paraferrimonas sp. SM1919 TaxID=2662263 RepID=UPI0013D66760|nr:hypothetical protein [Paraferrimonas sp. SM1919]